MTSASANWMLLFVPALMLACAIDLRLGFAVGVGIIAFGRRWMKDWPHSPPKRKGWAVLYSDTSGSGR